MVAAALVVALSAAGMAGCRPAAQPRDYFVMYINEPTYIDPFNAQESEGVQVVYDTFDSLVDFNPITSELEPMAAESWESSKDFMTWTFKLRAGAKFHNGRDVKAEDFIYAWNRIASPADKTVPVPSEIAYHLAPIDGFEASQADTKTVVPLKGLKALDDTTLEVKLAYAFPDFIYVVGHPALAPVPKEEVEKDPKAFTEKPVGNGPFMLTEPWKHNQYIKTARFDGYWGDKAKVTGVTYKIFKDPDTAFLEFRAGKVDFTKEIPTGQIKSTEKEFGTSSDGYTAAPGQSTLLGGEASVYFLNANNKDRLLSNPKLRAAISLAVNRQNICDTVWEGTRKPATGFVPPGIVGFKPDQGKYCKYDPTEAKKLLAEAGYPDGKGLPPIDLSYNSDGDHAPTMQAVQANLKEIGIESKLSGMEWAQFVDYRQAGKHQLARDGWLSDYPIADNMLYPLFISTNAGTDNTSFYANPRFDTLVKDARKVADVNGRVAKYQEAERVMLDDAGCIPLMFYSHHSVAQKYVTGLVHSPMDLVRSNTISFTEKPKL
jgi:peptide/nickel transport system substrate-binding protein/oligopeptide transport system substrate-binding protein